MIGATGQNIVMVLNNLVIVKYLILAVGTDTPSAHQSRQSVNRKKKKIF